MKFKKKIRIFVESFSSWKIILTLEVEMWSNVVGISRTVQEYAQRKAASFFLVTRLPQRDIIKEV